MSLARQYQLAAFFVLAYAVTWALWIPAAPFLQGLGDGHVPVPALLVALLGGYGPSVAAVVVVAAQGGRGAVKALLRHFLVWRVAPVWYALIVLVPLLVAAAAVALHVALGGASPMGWDLSRWYLLLPAMLARLPTGPLAEEAGWRGFALPRLQARVGPVVASLTVGVAWGLWHLPAFFIPGAALPLGATIGVAIVAWYVLGTVATSVFFTWVYNNTRQSLLIDVLFHAAINTAPAFVAAMIYRGTTTPALAGRILDLGTVVMAAIALVLVVVTRGRLSYEEVCAPDPSPAAPPVAARRRRPRVWARPSLPPATGD